MIDEDHVLILAYNLLCSIKYLHSTNIMHWDLKPDNILVTAECKIKICDFGYARIVPNT